MIHSSEMIGLLLLALNQGRKCYFILFFYKHKINNFELLKSEKLKFCNFYLFIFFKQRKSSSVRNFFVNSGNESVEGLQPVKG